MAELAEAREVATVAIEKYGDWQQQQELWDRFRRQGIWNDHAAVQSALAVIMARSDAERYGLARVRRAVEALPEGGAMSRAALLALLDQIDRDEVAARREPGQ